MKMYTIEEISKSMKKQMQLSLPPKIGKIEQSRLGTIHLILLKSLQYVLSQILQMRCPVIHDVVVQTRNLVYKIVSIVFSSLYRAFNYNI